MEAVSAAFPKFCFGFITAALSSLFNDHAVINPLNGGALAHVILCELLRHPLVDMMGSCRSGEPSGEGNIKELHAFFLQVHNVQMS